MAQTAQLRRIEHPENEAQRIFALQREAYLREPYPSAEERRRRLRTVERLLIENRDAIAAAIHRDFGHRATEESLMLELFTCVDGLRHATRKVRSWMKPERRPVSLVFATGRNRLIPQPKGVVGIASPWNYPLFLTVSPLTSALAAGNRVMIKMASHSQTLCRLLHEKLSAALPE
jgi:coniferyl-aldehyde dehydrogenase